MPSAPPPIPGPTPGSAEVRWFAEEVYPHDTSLKAYLRGSFPAVAEVEDVVQESYLRLWKMRAREPIRSAKALLFTVARRIALDLLRRDHRSPLVRVKDIGELFVSETMPTPFEATVAAQDVRLLAEAIDTLPARCREIFVLCQVECLTQREVARRLGISENTVAVQSARGLLRCEAFVRRRLLHE